MMQLLAMRIGALLLATPVLVAHAILLRGNTYSDDPSEPPHTRCRITGRIYGFHSDGIGMIQGVQPPRLPQHIIIETPKPVVAGLRAEIQNASASSFNEQPRLTFVTFDADSKIDRSPHGVPVLRSMFQAAIDEFPEADTFTYFNSDIAVDRTFLKTADAVVAAVQKGTLKPDFLVVGRRTNVDWQPPTGNASETAVFLEEFQGGTLFATDAEDYFMVSKTTWKWSDVPAFIVGHRGFDNWLVSEAALLPRVDLVDATRTLHAMHMTDARIGNKEGFKQSKDGRDYNMHLMRHTGGFKNVSWICGSTDGAKWATKLDSAGQVAFAWRQRSCP